MKKSRRAFGLLGVAVLAAGMIAWAAGTFEKEEAPAPQPEPAPVVELPVLNLAKNRGSLTDDQVQILRALDAEEGKLTDDIAEELALPVRRVLSAMTMLEIDGYVTQQGARRFVRAVEIMEEKKEG